MYVSIDSVRQGLRTYADVDGSGEEYGERGGRGCGQLLKTLLLYIPTQTTIGKAVKNKVDEKTT